MKRWCTLRCLVLGILIAALPIGGWWWFRCGVPTTLIVVRHADCPTTGEDALTPAGLARAQVLAHIGAKAGIAAVYHSDTNRTRDTVLPLATALGLTPVVYPYADIAGVVAQVFADHRGETVVIAGHSDTVLKIIEEAGGPTLPDIDGTEFDDLFVLTACSCRHGRATLANLQYGLPSP